MTTASVIEAMASASADGWAAASAAQEVLREQWLGVRSHEFGTRVDDLTERARELLARMDCVAPDLRAAISGYVDIDRTSAVSIQARGSLDVD